MPKAEFAASVDCLSDVMAFIEGYLEQMDCPPKAALGIATAAEEIFVNIARYSGSDRALLDLDCDGGVIRLSLTDFGTPFNPLAREDPDTTLGAGEREIGGLGIFMVKKMMDTVSYERTGESNILRMEKRYA